MKILPFFFRKISFHREVGKFINYYIFTIINAIIGIISISYLTIHFQPEDYGMIGIFTSILFFTPSLVSFSSNGLQSIEIVDLDKNNYLLFRNSYISFVLIFSILIFIIAGIFAWYITDFAFVIITASIMGFVQTLSTVHNTELIQYSQPTRYGIISTITAIIGFAFTIVFISIFKLNWKSRIIALLISEIIMLIVRFYFLSSIGTNFKFYINKENFKYLLNYGAPLMLSVIAGWVLNQSDRYFLLKYYSLKEVGLYAAAAGIASFITLINANMIKVVYPIVYKKLNLRVGKKFILKLTAFYSLFILVIAIAFSISLHFLGRFFLGEKFLAALPIVYIMCIAQAFFGIYTTTGLVIDYFKKTKLKTILVMTCAILVILLSFIFIPIFGTYGPAAALLISFISLSILSFFISKYLFNKFNVI